MEKLTSRYRRPAASHRTEPAPALLCWRRLLAQRLSQEEEAVEDLRAFVAELGDSSIYAGQVRDARRRLRLLDSPSAIGIDRPSPRWAAGLGIALGGVGLAGAGAGLHGGTWAAADYDGESNTHGVDEPQYLQLQAGKRAGFAMRVGGGVTAAPGGILAAVGSREPPPRSRT